MLQTFLLLIFSSSIFFSCSSIDAEFPTRNLINPEATGKLGKGNLLLEFHKVHRATMPPESNLQANDLSLSYDGDAFDTGAGLSINSEIGLWDKLDVLFDVNGRFGFKFQFLGASKIEGNKGNQSLSVAATVFENEEDDVDADWLFGQASTARLEMESRALHALYGYRITSKSLVFIDLNYKEYEFTTLYTSGTLTGNRYTYESSEVGLSSGFFIYEDNLEIGLEFAYQPFRWTYSDKEEVFAFNAKLGWKWY